MDLFKGKLAHLMVGWAPKMPGGDVFDAPTVEKTREFQQACGLDQTGEADAPTWHALDSFTRADVPFSIVRPLFQRDIAAMDVGDADPAASLPLLEGTQEEARALGLTEMVKNSEALIGRAHHRLSHFPEAVAHYELYLTRNIPSPDHYGSTLEQLRRAHQGLPPQ